MFIAAAEAGLPCFTEGVNTLLDRLSFYQMSEAADAEGPLLDSATLARQEALIARLPLRTRMRPIRRPDELLGRRSQRPQH